MAAGIAQRDQLAAIYLYRIVERPPPASVCHSWYCPYLTPSVLKLSLLVS
jgi:hypothetical protein